MKNDMIYHLDSIEGMSELPEGSVDLVFAEPPFNDGTSCGRDRVRQTDDDYLQWSERWIREVWRVLKPNGTFWLGMGDEFAAELKILATRTCGFHCRNWIIWHYTYGMHCRRKFTRSHTHLFYFVKDKKNFTFDDKAARVPSARQFVYGDRRANPAGKIPDDTWLLRPQEIPGGFEGDQSVWYFADVNDHFRERTGWHGCQMPEILMDRIISTTSRPGDLVLDPFVGSGTTAAVAKKRGRRFLGFEISDSCFETAQKRLAETEPGQPILTGFFPPKAEKRRHPSQSGVSTESLFADDDRDREDRLEINPLPDSR